MKENGFLVLRILCVYINAANCALQQTNTGVVTAGLDDHGFFLDANHLADDTADGGDFVANHQIVTHIVGFLLLLLLRTDDEKIEHDRNNCNQAKRHPSAAHLFPPR